MHHRILLSVILAGALAVTAGCGGGSSSTGPSGSGGGSSTAVVQGQVTRTSSAANQESVVVIALRTALGIGLAEAQNGTPVEGATVTLTCNGFTDTTTTDPNGNFVFQNVPPSTNCTVMVTATIDGTPVTKTTDPFTVGAGDNAVVGVVTSSDTTVTVVAQSTDVLNNDAQLGHAINIDNASSTCDLIQVLDKREMGKGWGLIAQECGAHPGVIGLGRSNVSDADLQAARGRAAQAGKGGKGAKGGKGGKNA